MLIVSTLAEGDLAKAVAWYNHIQPGLGDDFLLCAEYAHDRILEHPEAFPMILPDVRRTRVPRFPYGVFFRVGQQYIKVEALFPLRVKPAGLQKRLRFNPKQDS